MNERIRELLVEARQQTKEGKWHAPTSVWAEKFAELIVRECAFVVFKQDERKSNLNLALSVLEHFGVEE